VLFLNIVRLIVGFTGSEVIFTPSFGGRSWLRYDSRQILAHVNSDANDFFLRFQARLSWGSHGLPIVLLGPAMPYHSMPETASRPFQGRPPAGRVAYSRLTTPWAPHAIRACPLPVHRRRRPPPLGWTRLFQLERRLGLFSTAEPGERHGQADHIKK
jgi:hypothetical protein